MFRKRKNPEDTAHLETLTPSRLYTRQEVEQILYLMLGGLVNDGLLLVGYNAIEEHPLWYQVEVTYDDEASEDVDQYETWYFFKQQERTQ